MSICESKYADADKTLDTILTEKVKSKVKKAVKETECCGKCGKAKKKVAKESAKKTYDASLLKEALTEKGVATIQKWISNLGVEEAARKTIDSVLSRIVGVGVDDLPDTSTFANGYEAVVEAYEQGDFQGGYQIARDTAKEMVEEEGGEGIFESTHLDEPNMVSIKSLKKGEFFKRKPDSKKVYVKGDWNPAANKYNCSLVDDMNQEFNVKKDSLVFTEFEY